MTYLKKRAWIAIESDCIPDIAYVEVVDMVVSVIPANDMDKRYLIAEEVLSPFKGTFGIRPSDMCESWQEALGEAVKRFGCKN